LGLVSDDVVVDLGPRDPIQLVLQARKSSQSEEDFLTSQFDSAGLPKFRYSDLDHESQGKPRLLMPLVPPEIWGCGITYLRSRAAREVETTAKGIYDRVYDADRPEVFFKATPHRCVGPNEHVCIREDSKWTVPEPELAVIIGEGGEILGFTIGNDVSARDIEGENPLYLPQAKIYAASCALGPTIVTSSSIRDPKNLKITMSVRRNGKTVFQGATSTASMKRDLHELASFLVRNNPVPLGSVCLTGTGIVPPDDFALTGGDVVEISIEKIGALKNKVKQL